MIKDKLHYLFYAFCILWLFLLDYVLKGSGLPVLAVYFNYLLYVLLSARLLVVLTYQSKFFGTIGNQEIYVRISLCILSFVLYALLQTLINPELSDFDYFRQNYSVVLPSFAIAILFGVYTLRYRRNVNLAFRFLFNVMLVVILWSEILSFRGSESDVGEDLRNGGVFDQANSYGYFLALFTLISAFDLIGYVKVNRFKYISAIGLVGGLLLILRTGSYGALLVSLGLICYLSLNYLKKFNILRILGFLVLGTGMLVAFIYSSQSINSYRVNALRDLFSGKGNSGFIEQETFNLRYGVITKGVSDFFENPIVGKGLRGRNVNFEERESTVHNVIVVELLKGGILGLIFIVLIYYHIFKIVERMSNPIWRRIGRSLFAYIFLIDNTLTYSSFLSMNAGVLALALIFTLVFTDDYLKNRADKQLSSRV